MGAAARAAKKVIDAKYIYAAIVMLAAALVTIKRRLEAENTTITVSVRHYAYTNKPP